MYISSNMLSFFSVKERSIISIALFVWAEEVGAWLTLIFLHVYVFFVFVCVCKITIFPAQSVNIYVRGNACMSILLDISDVSMLCHINLT